VAFTAELLEAGIAGSIVTVGDALDNALCESTIGLFKTEAIDDGGPTTWTDRSAVEWQAARWVHWYNTRRLHFSIGYLPLALEVSTSTVCRSVLTPPGPGGHPSVGGS
jgi:transposase InsO family protein